MLLHRHRLLREQSKAANQAAREALAAEHARRSDELERREAIAPVKPAEPVSVEAAPGADVPATEVELPSSAADLRALDEAALRSLAASLDIELDGRWGVGRIRREVAESLGIDL